MRKGWVELKLCEIGETQTGNTPATNEPDNYGNFIPFVKPAHFKVDGTIDSEESGLSKKGLKSARLFKANSILMVCIGATIGKTGFSEIPVTSNQQINALTPKPEFEPRFFYYALTTDSFFKKIILGSSQATLPIINKSKWENLTVSVPKSKMEQKQIVSILDEAFAAIDQAKENLQRNLQNAKDLFESQRETEFANLGKELEGKSLEDFFSIKHGLAFKSQYFSNDGHYVLLTPGNFFEEGGYRDRGDKQKYYIGEIPSDYILHKNDILIAMTEQAAGLLGSPIIVPESDAFLHNQRLGLIVFKNKNEVDTNFLFHLFNTKRIRKSIHESSSGVKVRHTSPTKVLQIRAFVPNISIQQQIGEKLDVLFVETNQLKELYGQNLRKLEQLKKSILQKAFSGELVRPERAISS